MGCSICHFYERKIKGRFVEPASKETSGRVFDMLSPNEGQNRIVQARTEVLIPVAGGHEPIEPSML